jgi:hypothetical protein
MSLRQLNGQDHSSRRGDQVSQVQTNTVDSKLSNQLCLVTGSQSIVLCCRLVGIKARGFQSRAPRAHGVHVGLSFFNANAEGGGGKGKGLDPFWSRLGSEV